jgi:dipeptidase
MRNTAVRIAVILAVSGMFSNLRPCTSIVVGRKASADGSVIFGHNEDDYGTRIVNAWKVPRLRHGPGETVKLKNGAEIPQVPETWAMLWFQVNGLEFSDYYCNEWNVAVASDACPSREDNPDLTEGGVGFPLRRIIAERARTAREGVAVAGALLDRFGYASSGRTLVICDPREGWLLSMAAGKHWIAQRVPDDGVAVLPNTYIVRRIDPADTSNFLSSADDVAVYAAARGWWNRGTDGPFDFAAAYRTRQSDSEALKKRHFDLRQWRGLSLLSGRELPEKDAESNGLPFSVKPLRPVGIEDVMSVLRDHYEGTPHAMKESSGANPHFQGERPICHSATLFSVVAQLRPGMTAPLRDCLWVAFGRPDTAPFTPWYSAIAAVPEGFHSAFSVATPEEAFIHHFDPVPERTDADSTSAFWTFKAVADLINADYYGRIGGVSRSIHRFEEDMFARRNEIDKTALRLNQTERGKTVEYLTRQVAGLAEKSVTTFRESILLTPKAGYPYDRRP